MNTMYIAVFYLFLFLKVPGHEIFEYCFLHQIASPDTENSSRICGDIRQNVSSAEYDTLHRGMATRPTCLTRKCQKKFSCLCSAFCKNFEPIKIRKIYINGGFLVYDKYF